VNASIVNLLDQAASRYGVDPNLAVSVAQQESGGNPNAVSSVGAQGVMQLMPQTAAALGVSNPFDPVENIDAGVRFLSQLIQQFGGDVQLALAAYNWGPGNVAKYGYSNWPAQTVNYVASILARIGATFTPPSSVPEPVTGTIDSGLMIDQALQPVRQTAITAGELIAIAGIAALIAYLAWS
jgi:hypothetical protein